MPSLILLFLLGYFVGGIPTAYIYCRIRGQDIRLVGSGNVGATNAARIFGRQAFIVIFSLDCLKGFIMVFFGVRLLPMDPNLIAYGAVISLIGTVTGHVWTIYLGFKGGKGVATSLGGLLAIMPMASAITICVFCVIFLKSKIVSLSSMCSAVFLAGVVQFLGYPSLYRILSILLAVFILYTHRSNVQRLCNGTEKGVQLKKK